MQLRSPLAIIETVTLVLNRFQVAYRAVLVFFNGVISWNFFSIFSVFPCLRFMLKPHNVSITLLAALRDPLLLLLLLLVHTFILCQEELQRSCRRVFCLCSLLLANW